MRPTLYHVMNNVRRNYSTPSSIQEWIAQTTAQAPTTHTDVLDPLRASHLLRTLPTRQHLSPPSVRDGDDLVKGGSMIYFQPETMLKDLGRDGSSTVCYLLLVFLPFDLSTPSSLTSLVAPLSHCLLSTWMFHTEEGLYKR
jgi:hypothetical protein